jgi:hypothetical protein
MLQSLTLFLAPEPTPQATLRPPPAVAKPARPLVHCRTSLEFGFRLLGDTVGFVALLSVCWFSLQLMQTFLAA